MRKRELQSFVVKLSDLKEYEAVRHERLENKYPDKTTTESSVPQNALIVKFGLKSQKEIRERIGLSSI